jgi:hypothetical protein
VAGGHPHQARDGTPLMLHTAQRARQAVRLRRGSRRHAGCKPWYNGAACATTGAVQAITTDAEVCKVAYRAMHCNVIAMSRIKDVDNVSCASLRLECRWSTSLCCAEVGIDSSWPICKLQCNLLLSTPVNDSVN